MEAAKDWSEGGENIERETLGEIGVGHYERWDRLQGSETIRHRNSQISGHRSEVRRLDSRRTPNPLPYLPGT